MTISKLLTLHALSSQICDDRSEGYETASPERARRDRPVTTFNKDSILNGSTGARLNGICR